MSFLTHRDPVTHRSKHPCPVCITYAALVTVLGIVLGVLFGKAMGW